MPVPGSHEVSGLDRLRAMLHDLPLEARREIRPAIKEITETVADEARGYAAQFSTRIPGAISTSVSFAESRAGGVVRVDTDKAPHARPYEGLDNPRDTFRRPRRGHPEREWIQQKVHRYLAPASRAKEAQAQALIEEAARRATESVQRG